MPDSEDIDHALAVRHIEEQGSAYADILEETLHAGHVAPQRFHLGAFQQRSALHDDAGEAFGPQLQQRFQWRLFFDAATLELADHDTGGIGFLHRQFRKCFSRLCIDGVDGFGARIIVGRSEMNHQQRRFFLRLSADSAKQETDHHNEVSHSFLLKMAPRMAGSRGRTHYNEKHPL